MLQENEEQHEGKHKNEKGSCKEHTLHYSIDVIKSHQSSLCIHSMIIMELPFTCKLACKFVVQLRINTKSST